MTDAAQRKPGGRFGPWCRRLFTEGFRPSPVGRWEWFIIRLGFAAIVFRDLMDKDPYGYPGQPSPEGIAKLVNLTWLHEDWARPLVLAVAAAACLAYIAGRGLPLALPVLFSLSTIVRTYQNSQGFHDHSHQLITLTLLAQSIVVWVFLVRRRRGLSVPSLADRINERSCLLYYSVGIIASTYVVAAMSKLMRSSGMWVINSPYIALDLVKAKRQNYYKNLDEGLAGDPEAAIWVLENPNIARLMFGGAFFLELFALFALKNRSWALAFGIGLILLHRSIKWMMGLNFATAELLLLLFFINVPFWIAWTMNRGRPSLQK